MGVGLFIGGGVMSEGMTRLMLVMRILAKVESLRK
jgi:hypothetical protein